MRHIFIYLILFTFILSCSDNKKSNETVSSIENRKPDKETQVYKPEMRNDSIVITETVNGINYFNYSLRAWNSISWETYEMTGNPDTAVSIHAYRLITSHAEPDFMEFDIYINLYEKTPIVKQIIQDSFGSENDIKLINKSIDALNRNFVEYAQQKVESDKKEFGQSDGPYFSFLEKINK